MNVFKVRRLAEKTLHHDLSTKMVMIDEKPVHVNESESKGVATLENEGMPFATLHTDHSASRERIIVMTCGVSDCKRPRPVEGRP